MLFKVNAGASSLECVPDSFLKRYYLFLVESMASKDIKEIPTLAEAIEKIDYIF